MPLLEVESNPAGFTYCKICSLDRLTHGDGGAFKACLRTGFFLWSMNTFFKPVCPRVRQGERTGFTLLKIEGLTFHIFGCTWISRQSPSAVVSRAVARRTII